MSFNKVKLADICTAITYGYTASAKSEPDNAKFLRITDIQGGVVDWDSVPYCEITPDHVDKYRLSHGDIVVARTGNSTGENYLFESDEVAVYASYLIKYSVNEDIADPFFVWLQMRTPKWWSFINGAKGGSAQAGANAKVIGDFDVALPPLSIQKQIVSLVKPYYDKIANNKAMNQTLEKLAQRIFKSWFIDFDPVKANKEGLPFDGLSPEIQALFPSEFEDSELGIIPKGWEVSTIENEVKTVGGATPSTKKEEFWESGHLLWTTPKDLSGLTDKVLFDTSRKITDAGLKKISSGLLPVNTVLMSSRAPVGYLALAKEKMAINQGYIGMICDKNLGSHFMLLWLDFNMESIKRRAGGTTFAEISKKAFRPMPILAPRKVILDKFESQVKPLFERIEANSRQNVNLSNIRDRLLPKLISGQISVGEATQELAEAV
ncbi:restriction endonuclease subunit S [Vibrio maritimus]|uniref:restriction endonuclease subunit S n=1 Tax=Vibrio maritimus TaxID=990268 RepID=UPI004069082F